MLGISLSHWLEILKVVGTFVGPLIAAWLAIRQVKLIRKQREQEDRKERWRRTLEIDMRVADLNDIRDSIDDAIGHLVDSDWKPIPVSELDKLFAAKPDLRSKVHRMLGEYEILATAVASEVGDNDLTFELLGTAMVKYSRLFEFYIHHRREASGRFDLYIYLTKLVEGRWSRRLNEEARLASQPDFKPLYLR